MAYWMDLPVSWGRGPGLGFAIGGPLYNLDFAVGANAANRADDVLLVQYLLREWARGNLGTIGNATGLLPY
jgi:hypothetical protein